MKIVCLSDTHRTFWDIKIPEADMLLFAGDIDTGAGIYPLIDFCNWLDSLPIKHKIIIAGNHDGIFQENSSLAKATIKDHAIYLENSGIEIEGLKMWGSPYTLEFFDWWFMASEKGIEKYWSWIPMDTNILITHQPPYGMLDYVSDGSHKGCKSLWEKVLKIRPLIHLFGHIHPAYGEKMFSETLFINGSICNNVNDNVNEPKLIEVISSGNGWKLSG